MQVFQSQARSCIGRPSERAAGRIRARSGTVPVCLPHSCLSVSVASFAPAARGLQADLADFQPVAIGHANSGPAWCRREWWPYSRGRRDSDRSATASNSAFFHSPSPGPHRNCFWKTCLPSASTTNSADAETVSTCSRNSVVVGERAVDHQRDTSLPASAGLSSVPLGGSSARPLGIGVMLAVDPTCPVMGDFHGRVAARGLGDVRVAQFRHAEPCPTARPSEMISRSGSSPRMAATSLRTTAT